MIYSMTSTYKLIFNQKSLFFFIIKIHKQSQRNKTHTTKKNKTELNKLRICGIIILVVRSLVGDEMIARNTHKIYINSDLG